MTFRTEVSTDCLDERSAGNARHRDKRPLARFRRGWRSRVAVASLASCTALLGMVGSAAVSAAPSSSRTAVRSGVTTKLPCPDHEGSPIEQFGSAVISLGEARYPDAFAGAYATACGTHLVIGVVRSAHDSAAFLAAVAARTSAATPYSLVGVQNSWSALSALSGKVAATTWARWQSEGLAIQSFGPDARTDTLLVTLETPTSRDLAALTAVARSLRAATGAVTDATYTTAAERVLQMRLGAAVRVAPRFGSVLTTVDRYDENPPFYGGDQITSVSGGYETWCTGGFAVKALEGNRAGDDFMLTAGHCGGAADWYLSGCNLCENHEGFDMGSTSTIWWQDPAHDDFQAILVQPPGGSSALGYVYYSGGYSRTVEKADVVTPGLPFTFDGSVTGEVRGVTAVTGDTCAYITDHQTGQVYEACNLIEGESSGATVCQAGDSGGPSYVVDGSTGGADPVGTIVAAGTSDGYPICFAELIGQELSTAHAQLLLG